MSSGATSVLAPPKPWERNREVNFASTMPAAPVTGNSAPASLPPPILPAPPPPPLAPSVPYSPGPSYSSYSSYSPYNSISPYSSPYSSYSSPYSSYPYSSYSGGQHPFPNYSLESSTRPLLDSLNHIIQAVNHVACFLDSTVFSVWTAVSTITGLVSALKNIRGHRWLLWLKNRLKAIKAASGKKRIILLTVVLSALLAANLFTKEEEKTKTEESINSSSSEIETNSISVNEDEFTFVRANYAFEPPNTTSNASNQLSFQAGDVLAINKSDVSAVETQTSKWIVGRMKDGRSGFFPSNYYKTKFPMARIKKIMQLDHEIGKVALATPILISKALEVFMQNLVDVAAERARQADSTKLEAIYLKNSVFETEQFDFLKDIVAGVEEKPAKSASDESPKRTATKLADDLNSPSDGAVKSKRVRKGAATSPSNAEKELKFVVYSAGEGEPVETANFKVSSTDAPASKAAISSILNEESITPELEPLNQ